MKAATADLRHHGLQPVLNSTVETTQPIDTESLSPSAPPRPARSSCFWERARVHRRPPHASLDYECYPEMAAKKLPNWKPRPPPLAAGPLRDRPSLGRIGVRRSERGRGREHGRIATPAFEAGQWLIDTLKEVVPIWKKEHWADGTSDWVHPGCPGRRAAMSGLRRN